jgi:protein-S-isoprenylcysteine O-methyltransferase Ste14
MMPNVVATRGVFATWVVFVPLMLWARGRVGKGTTKTRELISLVAIALQGVGLAIAWNWHGETPIPLMPVSHPAQWAFALTAVVLAFASVLFGVAAIRVLGKQWSLVAKVVEGHLLIRSGPYRIVRHPIYLTMMGLLIATGIAFGTPFGIGLGVGVYLYGTWLRVRFEERLLFAKFGDSYAQYAQEVPAILPAPWRYRIRKSLRVE